MKKKSVTQAMFREALLKEMALSATRPEPGIICREKFIPRGWFPDEYAQLSAKKTKSFIDEMVDEGIIAYDPTWKTRLIPSDPTGSAWKAELDAIPEEAIAGKIGSFYDSARTDADAMAVLKGHILEQIALLERQAYLQKRLTPEAKTRLLILGSSPDYTAMPDYTELLARHTKLLEAVNEFTG